MPAEKSVQLECLRCHSVMEFKGSRVYGGPGAFDNRDCFLIYRCPACGKVEFFEPATFAEDIQCMDCGAAIAPGQEACPNCGWTWHDK